MRDCPKPLYASRIIAIDTDSQPIYTQCDDVYVLNDDEEDADPYKVEDQSISLRRLGPEQDSLLGMVVGLHKIDLSPVLIQDHYQTDALRRDTAIDHEVTRDCTGHSSGRIATRKQALSALDLAAVQKTLRNRTKTSIIPLKAVLEESDLALASLSSSSSSLSSTTLLSSLSFTSSDATRATETANRPIRLSFMANIPAPKKNVLFFTSPAMAGSRRSTTISPVLQLTSGMPICQSSGQLQLSRPRGIERTHHDWEPEIDDPGGTLIL